SLPELVRQVYTLVAEWNRDGLMRDLFIESAGNGRALIQVLLSEDRLPPGVRVVPIKPRLAKPVRARQSSRWMEQGAFLLPAHDTALQWLPDYEDELFTFPNGQYADQVDMTSQLINAL